MQTCSYKVPKNAQKGEFYMFNKPFLFIICGGFFKLKI